MDLLGYDVEDVPDDEWHWLLALWAADQTGGNYRLLRLLRNPRFEMTQQRRDLLADLLEKKQKKGRGRREPLFPQITSKKARLEEAANKVRQI